LLLQNVLSASLALKTVRPQKHMLQVLWPDLQWHADREHLASQP